MYNSISPIPGAYEAGTITRSGGYQSLPAVHPKGGATKGSSVVTLTGTPAYGLLLQYSVELTNVINGQVSSQIGLFTYNRSSAAASLADFIGKFATHLARYHDIEVTGTSGTTITLRSTYFGFTPNLVIQTPSITASNVLTVATAPLQIAPGCLATITPTLTGFEVRPFTATTFTASSFHGVIIKESQPRILDGRDSIYNVLISGFISTLCGGTGAKTSSNTLMYAYTNGNRPGLFSFDGFSDGATARVAIAYPNASSTPLIPVNLSRQIRPITSDVLPGQTFEMQIKGI